MFPSGVAKPRMLGILAGMDQKDSCDMVPMFKLLKLWSLRSCSPSRSSTSLSWRRGSLSWSRLFVRTWTFHSCSTRWSMSLLCGPAILKCRRGGDSWAPTVAARCAQDWLLHARCVQQQVPSGSECRKLRWSRSCSALTR